MRKSLYIDGEWFIRGRLFLLGYCYNTGKCLQLIDSEINKVNIKKILIDVEEIYFYGPDIGILEKQFNLSIRNEIKCFNLLKIFRQVLPPQKSYKLSAIEKKFGVKRSRVEYKKNIFDIFSDWRKADKRKRILEYNQEDVINLRKLKQIIFKKYRVKLSDEDRLK